MTRTGRGLAIAVLAVLISGACRQAVPGQLTPQVFVVSKGSSGDFWRTVRAGASQAGKQVGVPMEWPSNFPEHDVEGQARVVRQTVGAAAREGRQMALALAPLAGTGYAPAIRELMGAGVRIVTFDEPVHTNHGDESFISYVGTDNRQAGAAAAEYLVRLVPVATRTTAPRVAVLRLNPLSNSTTIREDAFIETIEKHGWSVEGRFYYAFGPGVESAYRESQALLDAMDEQGIRLDAIFCPNESTTMGMFAALEDRRLTGTVTLIGFDQTPLLVNALWRGKVAAIVVQDPHQMGYWSVLRALEVLRMDQNTYRNQVAAGSFKHIYTSFAVADLNTLRACQAIARARGLGDLEGPSLAAKLLASPTAPRPDEQDCFKVLRLLYPDEKIFHGQSSGAKF